MTQTATWTTSYRVPVSLPNDTEESIVGTEWHQEAIGALASMLRDVARRRGAPWGVCEQIALVGLQYPDGHPYDPRPDVMVLPWRLPGDDVASIPLAETGVPLLIVEVASEATATNDRGDKKRAYEAIGVPEYITFDPAGHVLPAPLLARRLEAGAYVPWHADAQGWWPSVTLDVAFQATPPFLGVRDRDRTVIQPEGAVRQQARRLEEQIRALEAEREAFTQRATADARRIAELEEQLRRLRGEIDSSSRED